MYFSLSQTRQVTASLLRQLASVAPSPLSRVDIFLMPDFVALAETAEQIRLSGADLWPGAQNCHAEDRGAYTGEGGLDGLFLGRFGHDPEAFVRTVREVAEA
ncbi:hypothetical protein E4U42_006949 [Claviceps africana]|uniref:triose-phosphate isomerase n=1 Tax=Claviceps africana TaxID=83212 RepID=A0A8K0NGE9_9HYPO|nr:hypothetical protein E4U42_006949 [Claviceps africana]